MRFSSASGSTSSVAKATVGKKTGGRRADVKRKTRETDIRLTLDLDGSGQADAGTGIGFFDHMLEALAKHGALDLKVACAGDRHVDDHHSVEDVGIVLGMAVKDALGDKAGIRRFGFASVPLDEALAQVTIDLSGRAANRTPDCPRAGSPPPASPATPPDAAIHSPAPGPAVRSVVRPKARPPAAPPPSQSAPDAPAPGKSRP